MISEEEHNIINFFIDEHIRKSYINRIYLLNKIIFILKKITRID